MRDSFVPNIFGFLLSIMLSICMASMLLVYEPIASKILQLQNNNIIMTGMCIVIGMSYYSWMKFFYIELQKAVNIDEILFIKISKESSCNILPGLIISLGAYRVWNKFIPLFLIVLSVMTIIRAFTFFMEKTIWQTQWDRKIESLNLTID